MNTMKNNTLRVPGATLSYEVRGKGPLLLLISGGGNDHSTYENIVDYLTDQYSVVTYDRRGLSQSLLDDLEEVQQVAVHSDDAHRLLNELGSEYEPAYVFGSSGGAIIGIDLVTRHPTQVHTLIAHEPPTHLVPKNDPIRELGTVRESYLQGGLMAAFQKLMTLPGLGDDGNETDVEQYPRNRDQMAKNMIFLLEREFVMYDHYQIDFDALKDAATQTRIVLAAGQLNRDRDAGYQSATAVADRLGSTIVEFPGRHMGYVTNPRAFAKQLLEVLGAS